MKTGKNHAGLVWMAFFLAIFVASGFGQTFIEEDGKNTPIRGEVIPADPAAAAFLVAPGGYDFNSGSLQDWTVNGPLDEDGNGPFASNFSASWADAVNHPTSGLSDPLGDNRGSYKICNEPRLSPNGSERPE